MKNNWKKITLADVATLYDSLHQTPQYSESGYSMVRVTDIKRGYLDLTGTKKVDESIYREFTKKYKPQIGDIVFSRVGSYGNSSYVNKIRAFCLGQNTVCISPNQQLLNSFFLYSCLNSPFVKQQIDACVGGSSQPTISLKNINTLQIPYPSLPVQDKIAAILSAYDRLIENNTRRIEILEEMARSLYDEWFVKFRFPSYEQTKMVDSELGLIPDGWKLLKLGDLTQELRRSINPEQIDPETPYLGLEHFPRKSIALVEWGTASQVKSTKLAFKKDEILFGKIRPYFHKVGVAPIDGVCSSDAIVIVPKAPEYFSIVLFCVSSENFVTHATQTSQGTKMPRANRDVLIKYPVAIAPLPFLNQFNDFVQSIVGQIQNLIFKNRNLRRTRDLLLPKLISGEIDVENIDIETEVAA